ncbi:conserved hypothetical protein [Prochlorococcus marinus str. MIT 9515]|uniref:Protein Thf1 n=1 Tax=Prochlorococcus marinus (strain MIT 9515) TaxID=167542 RepID=A2BW89_PROM5|nr:conserved hypothetical protein [Prochlorococcus marinus str. MIT 9515]
MTVSESKKLFHEQFPFVIPGLYKRIVDEMLVELNLLNHQNEFIQDELFCVGLTETFKELTKGYKPESHLELLFESLCKSSNFIPSKIKEISLKTLEQYKDKSLKEISILLKEKSTSNLYSSRILNIGIYLIIANATDFKGLKDSEKNKAITDNINNLNLSVNKAEKDIGIYKSSIKKMEQAKELLEEAKIQNKKKENK